MTAAAILADANPATFPTDLLAGADTAIAFFGAGFLGRNDVVHLWAAGIPSVTVVDTDEAKLVEMDERYAATGWRYLPSDAYSVARDCAKHRRAFDVVTVDPWSGGVNAALYELPLWLSLAKRAVVIGVTKDWLDGMQLGATLGDFNRWARRNHWPGGALPEATRFVRRSSFRGGVWWAAFEVRA